MFARFCFVSLTLFSAAPMIAAAQDNTLVLDPLGRVLVPFHRAGTMTHARLVVRGVDAARAAAFELRCRQLSSFDNTAVPTAFDTPYLGTPTDNDVVFSVPLSATPLPFLFCSLMSPLNPALTPEQITTLKERRLDAKTKIGELTPRVNELPEKKTLADRTADVEAAEEAKERQLDAAADALKLLVADREERIGHLLKDVAAFQQRETDSAVAEIKRLQAEIRTLRDQIAAETLRVATLEANLTAAVESAEAGQKKAEKNLASVPLNQELMAAIEAENIATDALTANDIRRYRVLNTSHLFLAPDDAPVFYRLLFGAARAVALERAAEFPILTSDSRVFAVVINRQRSQVPEPLRLTFTTTAGTPPDVAPVRPTTFLAEKSTVAQMFLLDSAYTDFVMAFGPPFRANTIIKASIATVMETLTESSRTTTTSTNPDEKPKVVQTKEEIKVQTVDLVKDEEYPLVRGLYRFNFTTGVAFSRLRDPSIVKVQTQLNDPATPDKDESRYQEELIEGDVSVKPMFAISFYPKPVDIQAPLSTWDRVRPTPMFGFAFQNPHENVYIGAASEPLRSLQVLYGWHIGKITKKRQPAAVDDPTSATAPATEKRFAANFFVGVSFNINFIKTIFTGGS